MNKEELAQEHALMLQSILPTVDMFLLDFNFEGARQIVVDMKNNLHRKMSLMTISGKRMEDIDAEAANIALYEAFVNLFACRFHQIEAGKKAQFAKDVFSSLM